MNSGMEEVVSIVHGNSLVADYRREGSDKGDRLGPGWPDLVRGAGMVERVSSGWLTEYEGLWENHARTEEGSSELKT